MNDLIKNLDDFVSENFPVDKVTSFLTDFNLKPEIIEKYCFFKDDKYSRNLVYKDEHFELLKQAESGIAKSYNQAIKISERIGLPLVVRPSYVLGGRAMEIVHKKNLQYQLLLKCIKDMIVMVLKTIKVR